jgi:hypothetical protein
MVARFVVDKLAMVKFLLRALRFSPDSYPVDVVPYNFSLGSSNGYPIIKVKKGTKYGKDTFLFHTITI